MWKNPFLVKLQACGLAALLKKTLLQVFLRIKILTIVVEHFSVAASENNVWYANDQSSCMQYDDVYNWTTVCYFFIASNNRAIITKSGFPQFYPTLEFSVST